MVPFHDLWRNGGESEKRSPCPQRVIEPAKIMKAISETHLYHQEFLNGRVNRVPALLWKKRSPNSSAK
jgi:hypothetical protein